MIKGQMLPSLFSFPAELLSGSEMSSQRDIFIHKFYIETYNIWKHRCLKKYVIQVDKNVFSFFVREGVMNEEWGTVFFSEDAPHFFPPK